MRKSIRHPFFRAPLRRHLTVLFLLLWACVELYLGATWWAVGVGALAAFCVYEFYITFDPKNYEAKDV